MGYTDEQIARVIHAANCALQAVQDDDLPSPPWESMPGYRQALLAEAVAMARSGYTASALHENWKRRMQAAGWTFGRIKDPRAKTHPCLVTYLDLPQRQRDKDVLLKVITSALSWGD